MLLKNSKNCECSELWHHALFKPWIVNIWIWVKRKFIFVGSAHEWEYQTNGIIPHCWAVSVLRLRWACEDVLLTNRVGPFLYVSFNKERYHSEKKFTRLSLWSLSSKSHTTLAWYCSSWFFSLLKRKNLFLSHSLLLFFTLFI